MSLWLNEDELVELTGYRQREKQRRARLRAVGDTVCVGSPGSTAVEATAAK